MVFEILEIVPYGDVSNGEAQQLKLSHTCPVLKSSVEQTIWFSKAFGGQQTNKCPDCNAEVEVIKEAGLIRLG